MTVTPLCLTGTLRQSDADPLRGQAIAQIAGGALRVQARNLEAIEFGPVQVLLCAAAEAKRLGLSCQMDDGAAAVVTSALAAVRLPDAAHFFSIVPATEMSVTP